jgi:hypothetical protein
VSDWIDLTAAITGYPWPNADEVAACEPVAFKMRLTEDGEIEFDRVVTVGPCERSAISPRVTIYDADGKAISWQHPPPGSGIAGTYVTLDPHKPFHEITP